MSRATGATSLGSSFSSVLNVKFPGTFHINAYQGKSGAVVTEKCCYFSIIRARGDQRIVKRVPSTYPISTS